MAEKGHNFTGRFLSWVCCKKCGLVKLNNEATRRAARAPCPGDQGD